MMIHLSLIARLWLKKFDYLKKIFQVASIASTPEPEEQEQEDIPGEPFPPRFDIAPEDAGVIEGDVAILQATISAWPEPEIKWFREGALIENCTDYQVTYEDGIAQLLIRNCYPDDAGKFTISARNQMGASSSTCILSVKSTSECDREAMQDKFEVYEESAQETQSGKQKFYLQILNQLLQKIKF